MIKRVFDFTAAAIGLAILWPVFLACAVFIWLGDGGPILFTQARVGLGGKQFYIRKFCTMLAVKTQLASAITIANDDRIKPIGKILRQMKLDELPQLINVLLGDMSLVGPRPEVPHLFLQYLKDLQIVMIGLRPGITDFASLEVALQHPHRPPQAIFAWLSWLLLNLSVFSELHLIADYFPLVKFT